MGLGYGLAIAGAGPPLLTLIVSAMSSNHPVTSPGRPVDWLFRPSNLCSALITGPHGWSMITLAISFAGPAATPGRLSRLSVVGDLAASLVRFSVAKAPKYEIPKARSAWPSILDPEQGRCGKVMSRLATCCWPPACVEGVGWGAFAWSRRNVRFGSKAGVISRPISSLLYRQKPT
jgi:hypothetical protein